LAEKEHENNKPQIIPTFVSFSDSPSTSNAELLKSVNPEILKAVAAVFKGAQISNNPRPSLGLPPGPQPVPPPSLVQAIAGANGTRSPAQAKIPSLMSLPSFSQGQSQTQFNNFPSKCVAHRVDMVVSFS
jgi:hypothetical protein